MTAGSEDYEVVKFYRTTKYPLMIGRLPDGTKIFGGPYTAAQGIAGAAMIILVLSTWGLWANFGFFGNIIVAATAVVVPVYLAGMIRTRNRNPATLFLGVLNALGSPNTGKLGDRAFKFRKPHHVRGNVILDYTPSSTTPPAPKAERAQAAPVAVTHSAAAPRQQRAVTAIERLMAETTPKP